mmetsp:Transcript_17543/g.28706  ORF Transcript_17543/g.28706 Transcript_17543/m.28706 type:complete len:412 (-) Transcript_17543:769-2004(-)|eukprot:scaffold33928_cov154-Skeletonema_menzelii.AAC.1
MEYSSDDVSVVSSGDEMLNIVVPFSQDSATQKAKGKKSESDDDTSVGSPGKKRKRVDEDVGNLKDDNNDNIAADDKNNDAIALADATTAFKIQFNDQKLGATNKLFWNERRQKKNAALYPVRVVPREEVVGLCLKEWDFETERPVQYIQYPHKQIKRDLGLYDVVSVKSLTPYHGDGPTDSWCSKRIQQYSKQLKRTLKGLTEIDLLTEEAFLKLVLAQSLKEEENERERSLLAETAPAEESAASENEYEQIENDSDDDEDIDGSGGGRRSRLCRSDSVKSEPLRVGDIIEYYKPTSVAGNPDALCEAEVKFINPRGNPILITSDIFTILPSDHQVKRVKRMHRGKHLDHPNGRFRAINNYVLKKEGNPNAVRDIMAETTARTKATIQRAKDEISSRMDDGGFFPRDLLRN